MWQFQVGECVFFSFPQVLIDVVISRQPKNDANKQIPFFMGTFSHDKLAEILPSKAPEHATKRKNQAFAFGIAKVVCQLPLCSV